jgi:hypothetical protein
MGDPEGVGLSKPVVQIVDRGADAVRQVRRWHRRERLFLIRAQGQEPRLLQTRLGSRRGTSARRDMD